MMVRTGLGPGHPPGRLKCLSLSLTYAVSGHLSVGSFANVVIFKILFSISNMGYK